MRNKQKPKRRVSSCNTYPDCEPSLHVIVLFDKKTFFKNLVSSGTLLPMFSTILCIAFVFIGVRLLGSSLLNPNGNATVKLNHIIINCKIRKRMNLTKMKKKYTIRKNKKREIKFLYFKNVEIRKFNFSH